MCYVIKKMADSKGRSGVELKLVHITICLDSKMILTSVIFY